MDKYGQSWTNIDIDFFVLLSILYKYRTMKKENYRQQHIIELRDRGLSDGEIAKLLMTGPEFVEDKLVPMLKEIRHLVPEFRKYEPDVLANLRRRILASITKEDIKKATLQQRAITYGILLEKENLLKGKPTQVIGYWDLVRMKQMLQKELAELENMPPKEEAENKNEEV